MNIISFVLGFVGMELFSIWVHKYLMHGPLWFLHKTHHIKTKGFFELNDSFSAFFGLMAIALIITGFETELFPLTFVGLGISAYGMLYFIIHDVLIHQRITFKWKPVNRYLAAMRNAHRHHHKHIEKNPGESYGLFLFGSKYYKDSK